MCHHVHVGIEVQPTVEIWFGATWDRARTIEGQGQRVPSSDWLPPLPVVLATWHALV